MGNWKELALEVLQGKELSNQERFEILNSPDEEILELLNGSYVIRHHYFGNKVKLNKIINTKSGMCPENCGYCSQSSISDAPIEKYRMIDKGAIIAGAKQAYDSKLVPIVSWQADAVRAIRKLISWLMPLKRLNRNIH